MPPILHWKGSNKDNPALRPTLIPDYLSKMYISGGLKDNWLSEQLY